MQQMDLILHLYRKDSFIRKLVRIMKNQLFLLATSALLLTSCTKDDVIEVSQLTIGQWSESYDNPNFVMDSKVDYAFKTDGTYTIECRHALVDTSETYTRHYLLQDNVLTLGTELPQAEQHSYNIVLMNEKEMAWQRVGTSYSEGTLSGDYKHFNHIVTK